ncbi:hypothetical protein PVAP13_3KG377461 [Panicum virgatum]|uniref:Uncharacterized protein n=1 Tax=Panicum virgatum TaxID=38727 RepID=A0A8T0V1F5_PANVG|nr:hypothetical protein PVAP13_3KG377461 [Panicum virgatum]
MVAPPPTDASTRRRGPTEASATRHAPPPAAAATPAGTAPADWRGPPPRTPRHRPPPAASTWTHPRPRRAAPSRRAAVSAGACTDGTGAQRGTPNHRGQRRALTPQARGGGGGNPPGSPTARRSGGADPPAYPAGDSQIHTGSGVGEAESGPYGRRPTAGSEQPSRPRFGVWGRREEGREREEGGRASRLRHSRRPPEVARGGGWMAAPGVAPPPLAKRSRGGILFELYCSLRACA